jgi:hypothetical protein
MDEIERLIILRIRDPETREMVRGRLVNTSAHRVTANVWEMPVQRHETGEDAEDDAQWWDDLRRWFEEVIDPRTDAIYLWTWTADGIIRSTIGGQDPVE